MKLELAFRDIFGQDEWRPAKLNLMGDGGGGDGGGGGYGGDSGGYGGDSGDSGDSAASGEGGGGDSSSSGDSGDAAADAGFAAAVADAIASSDTADNTGTAQGDAQAAAEAAGHAEGTSDGHAGDSQTGFDVGTALGMGTAHAAESTPDTTPDVVALPTVEVSHAPGPANESPFGVPGPGVANTSGMGIGMNAWAGAPTSLAQALSSPSTITGVTDDSQPFGLDFGSLAPTAPNFGPGQVALANARAGIMSDLNNDPGLAHQFAQVANHEVGNQGLNALHAFTEETMDRAIVSGRSLTDTLNDKSYFPGVSRSGGHVSDAFANTFGGVLSDVGMGSNFANFGTGNASPGHFAGLGYFAGTPATEHAGFNQGVMTAQYGNNPAAPIGARGSESFGIEGPTSGTNYAWATAMGYTPGTLSTGLNAPTNSNPYSVSAPDPNSPFSVANTFAPGLTAPGLSTPVTSPVDTNTPSAFPAPAISSVAPEDMGIAPSLSSVSPVDMGPAPSLTSVSPVDMGLAPSLTSVSPVSMGPANSLSQVSAAPMGFAPSLSQVSAVPMGPANTVSQVSAVPMGVAPTTLTSVTPDVFAPTPTLSGLAPTTSSVTPSISNVSAEPMGLAPSLTSISPVDMGRANTLSSVAPVDMGLAPTLSSVSPVSMGLANTLSSVSPVDMGLAPSLSQVSAVPMGPANTVSQVSAVPMGVSAPENFGPPGMSPTQGVGFPGLNGVFASPHSDFAEYGLPGLGFQGVSTNNTFGANPLGNTPNTQVADPVPGITSEPASIPGLNAPGMPFGGVWANNDNPGARGAPAAPQTAENPDTKAGAPTLGETLAGILGPGIDIGVHNAVQGVHDALTEPSEPQAQPQAQPGFPAPSHSTFSEGLNDMIGNALTSTVQGIAPGLIASMPGVNPIAFGTGNFGLNSGQDAIIPNNSGHSAPDPRAGQFLMALAALQQQQQQQKNKPDQGQTIFPFLPRFAV